MRQKAARRQPQREALALGLMALRGPSTAIENDGSSGAPRSTAIPLGRQTLKGRE
jgi:hypothetical protein